MKFNSGLKKIVGGMTFLFFFWQTTSAYALPVVALLPKNIARVQSDSSQAKTDKTVFFLLNAHTSSDAQAHIAELLKFFQSQGIDLIGLEGADEKIDGKVFRKFPFKDSLAHAAWQMVEQGKFTGAEYFYITADKLPHFYGLEDKALYLENRDAFIQTSRRAEELKETLETLRASLGSLKKKIYSKRLFEFDRINRLHDQGNLSYIDFLAGVVNYTKHAQTSLPDFPNTYALSKAMEKEKKINQKGLEKDLNKIREDLLPLTPTLSPSGGEGRVRGVGVEIDETIFDLVLKKQVPGSADDSLDSYKKVYTYFSNLIEQKKIDRKRFNHFSKYFDWLSSFESFDPSKLFDELNSLVQIIYGRLAKSEEEKTLFKITREFDTFEKMLSIQLTQKEWDNFSSPSTSKNIQFFNIESALSFIKEELGSQAPQIGSSEISLVHKALSHAQHFYELAEKRNQIFSDKVLREMDRTKKNTSVIVIGGFHEKGLQAIFEKQGVSTVMISPKIGSHLSDIPYLERMIGKPTLLETVLEQAASALENTLKVSGIISHDAQVAVANELDIRAAVDAIVNQSDINSHPEAQPKDLEILRFAQNDKLKIINQALHDFSIEKINDEAGNFVILIKKKNGKSVALSVRKSETSPNTYEITTAELKTPSVVQASRVKSLPQSLNYLTRAAISPIVLSADFVRRSEVRSKEQRALFRSYRGLSDESLRNQLTYVLNELQRTRKRIPPKLQAMVDKYRAQEIFEGPDREWVVQFLANFELQHPEGRGTRYDAQSLRKIFEELLNDARRIADEADRRQVAAHLALKIEEINELEDNQLPTSSKALRQKIGHDPAFQFIKDAAYNLSDGWKDLSVLGPFLDLAPRAEVRAEKQLVTIGPNTVLAMKRLLEGAQGILFTKQQKVSDEKKLGFQFYIDRINNIINWLESPNWKVISEVLKLIRSDLSIEGPKIGPALPTSITQQLQPFVEGITQFLEIIEPQISPDSSRAEVRSRKGKVQWEERLREWREKYKRERQRIIHASSLEEVLQIIREIHGPISKKEIQKIEAYEHTEQKKKGPSRYPLFSPRGVWNQGLVKGGKGWGSKKAGEYYYHGTSLGILRVAAVRGFLGGVLDLTDVLAIVKDDFEKAEDQIYFADADYYKKETELPSETVLKEVTTYADRNTRPARAILIYYALRSAWEKEGRKERFPPFQDFLQRVILRIPKKDVGKLKGTAFWSQLSTDTPVPILDVEILLDQDIPIPKPLLIYGSGLSDNDIENPNLHVNKFGVKEYLRLGGMRFGRLERITNDRIEAIGRYVSDKWKPIRELQPTGLRAEVRSDFESSPEFISIVKQLKETVPSLGLAVSGLLNHQRAHALIQRLARNARKIEGYVELGLLSDRFEQYENPDRWHLVQVMKEFQKEFNKGEVSLASKHFKITAFRFSNLNFDVMLPRSEVRMFDQQKVVIDLVTIARGGKSTEVKAARERLKQLTQNRRNFSDLRGLYTRLSSQPKSYEFIVSHQLRPKIIKILRETLTAPRAEVRSGIFEGRENKINGENVSSYAVPPSMRLELLQLLRKPLWSHLTFSPPTLLFWAVRASNLITILSQALMLTQGGAARAELGKIRKQVAQQITPWQNPLAFFQKFPFDSVQTQELPFVAQAGSLSFSLELVNKIMRKDEVRTFNPPLRAEVRNYKKVWDLFHQEKKNAKQNGEPMERLLNELKIAGLKIAAVIPHIPENQEIIELNRQLQVFINRITTKKIDFAVESKTATALLDEFNPKLLQNKEFGYWIDRKLIGAILPRLIQAARSEVRQEEYTWGELYDTKAANNPIIVKMREMIGIHGKPLDIKIFFKDLLYGRPSRQVGNITISTATHIENDPAPPRVRWFIEEVLDMEILPSVRFDDKFTVESNDQHIIIHRRAEVWQKFEQYEAIAEKALQVDGGDDYFVKPTIVDPTGRIRKGDSVIFVNFRGDRADPTFRLLSGDPTFHHWPLEKLDLALLPFGNYSDRYFKEHGYSSVLSDVAYPNTLGEVWAQNGFRQLRIAESEKYKHVTYFFDGLRDLSKALPGLVTELIPSNKLERHDQKPEMKAGEITDRAIDYILGRNGVEPVQVGVINFANSDILGHFDNFEAVVQGVLTVDQQIARLWEAIQQVNGVLMITADHGSAEEMAKLNLDGTLKRDESGKPIWNKAHAYDNKVDLIVLGAGPLQFKENGSLKNIAPTILELQGLEQPQEMNAKSLLETNERGQMKGRPIFIVIRDGQGINKWKDPQKYPEAFQFDAVYQARLRSQNQKLIVDRIVGENPHGRTELWTHGSFVGHPETQMGDSETGHSNIGVGRDIETPLSRLNQILEGESFANLPHVRAVLDNAKKPGGTLHLFGMISPGGVHSHTDHFLKLLDVISKEQGIERVVLHAVFDGRDTDFPGWRSLALIHEHVLSRGPEFAQKFVLGDFAGRFYAMDRDGLNRDLKGEDGAPLWNERTLPWYDVVVHSRGRMSQDVLSSKALRSEVRMKKDFGLRSFFEWKVGVDATQLSHRNTLARSDDLNAKYSSVFRNVYNDAVSYFNRFFDFAWLKLHVKRIRFTIEFNLHRLFSFSQPISSNENDVFAFTFVNNLKNSTMKVLLSQISFAETWLSPFGIGYSIFDLFRRQFSLENPLFNVLGVAKLHKGDHNLREVAVNQFLSRRAEVRAKERKFRVEVKPDLSYQVEMTRNVFDPKNPLLAKEVAGRKTFVIIDQQIGRKQILAIKRYFKANRIPSAFVTLPGGEQVKDAEGGRANVERLAQLADEAHLDRKSVFVLIGGGALLDVGGFTASIFHRGVPYVRIPTTLLGQIDAGIGVKTGINYFGQKNFFGTFYPPQSVLVDPFLLNTLDERTFRSGIAEAIKVALMKDKNYFDLIERDYQDLLDRNFSKGSLAEEIMWLSIVRHLEQIRTDPFERELARPLDYGHEWAHRLEVVSDYQVMHGEAVAIGTAIDTYISYKRGYIDREALDRVLRLIEKVGLPIYDERATVGNLWPGVESFRRHLGGKLTISLLGAIGTKKDVHSLKKEELSAALRYLKEKAKTSSSRAEVRAIKGVQRAALSVKRKEVGASLFTDDASRLRRRAEVRTSLKGKLSKKEPEFLRFLLKLLEAQQPQAFSMGLTKFQKSIIQRRLDGQSLQQITDELRLHGRNDAKLLLNLALNKARELYEEESGSFRAEVRMDMADKVKETIREIEEAIDDLKHDPYVTRSLIDKLEQRLDHLNEAISKAARLSFIHRRDSTRFQTGISNLRLRLREVKKQRLKMLRGLIPAASKKELAQIRKWIAEDLREKKIPSAGYPKRLLQLYNAITYEMVYAVMLNSRSPRLQQDSLDYFNYFKYPSEHLEFFQSQTVALPETSFPAFANGLRWQVLIESLAVAFLKAPETKKWMTEEQALSKSSTADFISRLRGRTWDYLLEISLPAQGQLLKKLTTYSGRKELALAFPRAEVRNFEWAPPSDFPLNYNFPFDFDDFIKAWQKWRQSGGEVAGLRRDEVTGPKTLRLEFEPSHGYLSESIELKQMSPLETNERQDLKVTVRKERQEKGDRFELEANIFLRGWDNTKFKGKKIPGTLEIKLEAVVRKNGKALVPFTGGAARRGNPSEFYRLFQVKDGAFRMFFKVNGEEDPVITGYSLDRPEDTRTANDWLREMGFSIDDRINFLIHRAEVRNGRFNEDIIRMIQERDLEGLRQILRGNDWIKQDKALYFLKRNNVRELAPEVAQLLEREPNNYTAIMTLGSFRNPRYSGLVAEGLFSDDAEVRRASLIALKRMNVSKYRWRIEELSRQDRRQSIRATAQNVLEYFDKKKRAEVREESDLKQKAADSLAQTSGLRSDTTQSDMLAKLTPVKTLSQKPIEVKESRRAWESNPFPQRGTQGVNLARIPMRYRPPLFADHLTREQSNKGLSNSQYKIDKLSNYHRPGLLNVVLKSTGKSAVLNGVATIEAGTFNLGASGITGLAFSTKQTVAKLAAAISQRIESEQMRFLVRLDETEVASLTSIKGMARAELRDLETKSDERVEFLSTLVATAQLHIPFTFVVSSEDQARELRQVSQWYLLNGQAKKVQLPPGAFLTAKYFGENGRLLVKEMAGNRTNQMYFLTDFAEASSLATKVQEAKFVATDQLAGRKHFTSGLRQTAGLVAALLSHQVTDQFQVAGNGNIFLPRPSLFENLVDSLTLFNKAITHILTQA